jgi:hypothetical protein
MELAISFLLIHDYIIKLNEYLRSGAIYMGTYVDLSNVDYIRNEILIDYNCIYNMDDFKKDYNDYLCSDRMIPIETIVKKINSPDILIASVLSQNIMLTTELEDLMFFTLNTILLKTPIGFCILSSSPSYVETLFYKELESHYHLNSLIINQKKSTNKNIIHNEYKFLFFGLNKDLDIYKFMDTYTHVKSNYDDNSILAPFIKSLKVVIDDSKSVSKQKKYIESLINELKELPLSDGLKYEDLLYKILCEVFKPYYPDHFDLKTQEENKGGLKRRDLILYNSGPTHRFLKDLKDYGAKWVLIEAKNSSKKLSPDKINNLITYLLKNPKFGKVAFLFTRIGVTPNGEEDLFRDQLQHGFEVVVFEDKHLFEMLNLLKNGGDAIRVLEEEYKNLSLQL